MRLLNVNLIIKKVETVSLRVCELDSNKTKSQTQMIKIKQVIMLSKCTYIENKNATNER